MSIVVGLAGRASLVILFAVALLATGCGGDEEPTLNFPAPTDGTTSESSKASDDTGAAGDTTETTDEPQSTTERSDSAADFTPATVRFDPDDPPSQQEVEDMVYAAVEADFNNLLWCWEHADICDIDRHLGPAIAEPRHIEISQAHGQFLSDGALYKQSDLDAIYRGEVLATTDGEFEFGEDSEYRLLGAVFTCEVFGGPYFVPADDGQPEQVINDDTVSYTAEYRVWQHIGGVLRVASRSFEEQGAAEGCDSFKG